MKHATKEEALRQWMSEWSQVPNEVVKIIDEQCGKVNLLTSVVPDLDYPVAHYPMYAFDNSFDEQWTRDNLDTFDSIGITVYEVPFYGLVFGVDGVNYSILEEHWIPLYEARGLQWHEEEDEGETA